MDESAKDLGRLKLTALLGEVDDLSSDDEVAPIIADFEKNYPSLFKAAATPGTGTRNQGNGAENPVGKIGTGNATQAEIDAAWAATS